MATPGVGEGSTDLLQLSYSSRKSPARRGPRGTVALTLSLSLVLFLLHFSPTITGTGTGSLRSDR